MRKEYELSSGTARNTPCAWKDTWLGCPAPLRTSPPLNIQIIAAVSSAPCRGPGPCAWKTVRRMTWQIPNKQNLDFASGWALDGLRVRKTFGRKGPEQGARKALPGWKRSGAQTHVFGFDHI